MVRKGRHFSQSRETRYYLHTRAQPHLFNICSFFQIRFRVAGINFSQVVTTARGVKSTTTTSVEENAAAKGPDPRLVRGNVPESAALAAGDAAEPPQPVRRRSCSVDLSLNDDAPPPMKVIGSCNEYGLGLASWWTD